MAPLISHVYELGYMEAIAIPQTECFQGISYFTQFKLIMIILDTIEMDQTCGTLDISMERIYGSKRRQAIIAPILCCRCHTIC
jgi:hypothetical protein